VTQNDNLSHQVMYQEWLQHPVTIRLNRFLEAQRQELLLQWSKGNFTGDSSDKTAQLNANALGQCEVLSVLIDLEFQQLYPEQENV